MRKKTGIVVREVKDAHSPPIVDGALLPGREITREDLAGNMSEKEYSVVGYRVVKRQADEGLALGGITSALGRFKGNKIWSAIEKGVGERIYGRDYVFHISEVRGKDDARIA